MKRLCVLALTLAAADPCAAEPEDDSAIEEITVVATRSRQLVRDQPVRVEVVPQEELEESQTVAPGNLTNLLNELAGARMDQPSAGLGGTSLRLRGMPGRHAQVLSDGLALSGSQTDSFSLLQVPPIDLGRVEVVKGVASALYGGSALAGVLNLVSRPPDGKSQWLLSQSSLGASDADVFFSRPGPAAGFTFAGSGHYQARRDEDHDGWSELPGYQRLTARPRWFIGEGDEHLFATLGFIGERREGGTRGSQVLPSGEPFPVSLDTSHVDAGMVGNVTHDDGSVVGGKWYAVHTRHQRTFGTADVDDSITSVAAEATWQAKLGIHEWTLGGALQYDELSVPEVAGVGYRYTVPGVFAQDEFSPAKWLSVSASARVDFHDEFGTFVSPRVSALFRLDPDVSLRASFGTGYSPVTPLVDEIEDVGFGALEPLTDLQSERASSSSLDLNWTESPYEINQSAYAS
jgi:outer membrane cobalamin receptor